MKQNPPTKKCFNPRTRKGCDRMPEKTLYYRYSFNPRTRKGCDRGLNIGNSANIGFNPRTRRGCDDGGQSCFRRQNSFQSTHPQGVRHRIHQGVFDASGVSIHAPAGGATAIAMIGVIMESMFQSTHPQGVRLHASGFYYQKHLFQSTHPQGVRHYEISALPPLLQFQSTHPQGVRLINSSSL